MYNGKYNGKLDRKIKQVMKSIKGVTLDSEDFDFDSNVKRFCFDIRRRLKFVGDGFIDYPESDWFVRECKHPNKHEGICPDCIFPNT